MTMDEEIDHLLPGPQVSKAYTVAMFVAQQLEVNLKAILYTADYHGWGEQIDLSDEEKKRYKDVEDFIDGPVSLGTFVKKLRDMKLIPSKRAFKIFDEGCKHRNKLSHNFLIEQDFDNMTKAKEALLVSKLNKMALELYQALLVLRKVRKKLERRADSLDEIANSEYGLDDSANANRKFTARAKKKNNTC